MREQHYKRFVCTVDGQEFTRTTELSKHLEKEHGIPGRSALHDNMLNLGLNVVRRKCFPCGFCATTFGEHNELLNHIDLDHYKQHTEISDWNIDKVIAVLLRQPSIEVEWQRILSSLSIPFDESFTWDKSKAEYVQFKLETNGDSAEYLSAEDLATYAFWQSNNANEYFPSSMDHNVFNSPTQFTRLATSSDHQLCSTNSSSDLPIQPNAGFEISSQQPVGNHQMWNQNDTGCSYIDPAWREDFFEFSQLDGSTTLGASRPYENEAPRSSTYENSQDYHSDNSGGPSQSFSGSSMPNNLLFDASTYGEDSVHTAGASEDSCEFGVKPS